jgi:hypothetical protein
MQPVLFYFYGTKAKLHGWYFTFGALVKNFHSGVYVKQTRGYSAFIPSPINREWEITDLGLISLLDKAHYHLGKLDAYSQYVNIDLFISAHVKKKATVWKTFLSTYGERGVVASLPPLTVNRKASPSLDLSIPTLTRGGRSGLAIRLSRLQN